MSAAAAVAERPVAHRVDPLDAFRLRAECRAYLWHIGEYDMTEAVDALALAAKRDGLDPDTAQQILANAFREFQEAPGGFLG